MDKTTATLIGVLILLMIPLALAINQCSGNYCNDIVIGKPSFQEDTENYGNVIVMNPGADSDKKGHLFSWLVEAIDGLLGKHGVSTIYYDVIVNVEKSRYSTDDIISYEIIIINKGYSPDRDGKLFTYLEGPNENKYKERQYEMELIPPTCPKGIYDRYDDTCILSDKTEVEPEKYIEIRQVTPPLNATLGEWKAVAEYESRIQPPIKAFDSFTLGPVDYTFIIIAGLCCFVFFKKKEHHKQGKDRRKGKWG